MGKKTWSCKKKKRYSSIREAHVALDIIRNTSKRDVVPCRIYLCDCTFYHITSKEKIK